MANYTKTTDFAAKDTLPSGDTNKVIRGSEFETEFDNIVTAIATKADLTGPTFTGTSTFSGVDINGGAIDATVIGGATPAAGTFTNLVASTVDLNGGALDGATIGANSAAAGTFTNLTASGTVNFAGATVTNLGTISAANLDGGTLDNIVVGGTSPAAGTFTVLTANTSFTSGNVDINGGAIDGTPIGANSASTVAGTTGTFSGNVTGANLAVSNWNTAYGWGDHSGQGYLTTVTFSNLDAGMVTTSSESFSSTDTQVPTNKAVIDYVAATIPGLTVTESSVRAHEAALAIAATQLTGNITVPGNVYLAPSGTGFTELRGNTNAGAIRFNCEANSHGVTIKGPPHSVNATYSLELPNADGAANQILTTDGNGKLSFSAPAAGVSFAGLYARGAL